MQVKVMNRVYRMSQEEYQGLLKMASDQVPFGVYAIEKKGYAELRNDKCESNTQLKTLIRGFKAQGFKVLANDGQILQPAGQDAMEGALMSAT